MTHRFLVSLWKTQAGSHLRSAHQLTNSLHSTGASPVLLQTKPGRAVSEVLGRKRLLLVRLPTKLWGAQEEELAFLPK